MALNSCLTLTIVSLLQKENGSHVFFSYPFNPTMRVLNFRGVVGVERGGTPSTHFSRERKKKKKAYKLYIKPHALAMVNITEFVNNICGLGLKWLRKHAHSHKNTTFIIVINLRRKKKTTTTETRPCASSFGFTLY